ncbi:MAG: hypothetical protein Q9174_006306 [Haloplaca sp. 1 TL-2023]
MHFTMKSSFALVAATLTATVSAHSWIEDISVIASNGTLVGESGFPRAFAKRGPGVNPDKEMVHLLPPNGRPTGNKILDSDPMCMQSQQQPKQSDGSPMLKASPGDMIAVRYQENGHVTLPQNQPGKPSNRGTIYIYGTTQPKADEKFLSIHKVWNPDGTGGDKRGKLLATEPFDDGQCHQVNGGEISKKRQEQFKHKADPMMGQDLWCQNNFKIPEDAPDGKPYTVYWVWDWDTAPGSAGQPAGLLEKYTTCMDISLSKGGATSRVKDAGKEKFAEGQDLNSAAIREYVQKLSSGSDIFVPGSVQGGKAAGSSPSAAAAPKPSAPASSAPAAAAPAPAQQSVPAAPAGGEKTVTVTAPGSAKTVTVTASAPQMTAANGPSTVKVTRQSTIYVSPTPASTMTSQVSAPQASSAAAAPPSMATPATVSGVVIPTTSIADRFPGTASAISSAPTMMTSAAAPVATAGSAPGVQKRDCKACKPAKRSTILSGVKAEEHVKAHVQGRSIANTKLRHSAKFRL